MLLQKPYSLLNFSSRDKPLAMYLFSNNQADRELIISNTSCGGICVNDTMGHFAGCIECYLKNPSIFLTNMFSQLSPYRSEVWVPVEWDPIMESMGSTRLRTKNLAW